MNQNKIDSKAYLVAFVAFDDENHRADEAEEHATGEQRLNEVFQNGLSAGEKIVLLAQVSFVGDIRPISDGDHGRCHPHRTIGGKMNEIEMAE